MACADVQTTTVFISCSRCVDPVDTGSGLQRICVRTPGILGHHDVPCQCTAVVGK